MCPLSRGDGNPGSAGLGVKPPWPRTPQLYREMLLNSGALTGWAGFQGQEEVRMARMLSLLPTGGSGSAGLRGL